MPVVAEMYLKLFIFNAMGPKVYAEQILMFNFMPKLMPWFTLHLQGTQWCL